MQQLLKLPDMGLILAPYNSGKTSLIKWLCLSSAQQIVAVVIFSKDGRQTYERNYSFVNRIYVHDTWTKEKMKDIILLGQKIQRNNPNHHMLVLFDDFIGMSKGFWETEEAQEFMTTLRGCNCTLLVSSHKLQGAVSTLQRNNAKKLFIFKQKEKNGIDLMYETWGKASVNLSNKKEFEQKIRTLAPHHFLYFDGDENKFTEMMTPHPDDMPKFRLYLHPSDTKEAEEGGYELVYGNKPGYNLKKLERQIEDPKNDFEDDGEPLFREKEEVEEGQEDGSSSDEEGEEGMDHIEALRAAGKKDKKREREEEEEPKETGKKKRKKEAHLDLLEEVQERTNEIKENLSPEDAHLRSKIIKIFKVIKTTDNPDRLMLDEYDKEFLQQDFNAMPFQQLLDTYTTYADQKELNKIIYGTASRYQIMKNLVHQFARGVLEFDGDPSVFTNHLDAMRHESTLKTIAETAANKRVKISSIDKFLNFAGPIATGMWAFWSHKQRTQKHNENLNSEIPDAEADILLDRIEDL